MAIELTNETFDKVNEGVALVDFWAPWCGPCRMLAPVIDKLSEEYQGRALVAKVNIDDHQDLAVKYGIRSIPTMLFFKDGEMVEQVTGALAEPKITEKLNTLLAE